MSEKKPPTCQCGCGKQVGVRRHSNTRQGWRKGDPVPFLPGHSNRRYAHDATCKVEGCPRTPESRGLCHSHFERLRRTGVMPTAVILDTDEARFLAKVKKLPSGHWMWIGATSSEGRYGAATLDGKVQPAHRVAWKLWRGPVDDDQDVDHLCRRTLCVNPDHLEPKTHRANVLCGEAPPALNAAKTHCIAGHEFTPENTRILKNGGRLCIACQRRRCREAQARYRARKRAAAA